jgi:large-conductance mechanosensitive channel
MAQSRKRRQPNVTQAVVSSGSTIRFEPPKSNRGRPPVVKVVAQEINPVGGFISFLREKAIVGLAVGFVVGTQAQALVKQLVSSFIDPAFQLLFSEKWKAASFTWHFHGRESSFVWGAFVYSLLNFMFILAAVYAIIKLFKLDQLDKPKKK